MGLLCAYCRLGKHDGKIVVSYLRVKRGMLEIDIPRFTRLEVEMFNKKTVEDVDVFGKRVLVRVDFNVPIKDGKVGDDTRIRAALPTLQYLLDNGAAVILCSHLGRPKGEVMPEYSMRPVAAHLSSIMGKPVAFAEDCIGPVAEAAARGLNRVIF